MHQFKRGDTPVDFRIIKQKYANWDSFIGSSAHIAIGDQLYEQQDHYCAYCEIYLHDKEDGFIEHLERQRDNSKRIFDWSNMFISCRKHDSCGAYKDNQAGVFKLADIVDPSRENPSDFFQYDLQGNMHPRKDLDPSRKRKAEETIRIFNLNCPRLANIRRKAINNVNAFLECMPIKEEISNFLDSLSNVDCSSVYHELLEK